MDVRYKGGRLVRGANNISENFGLHQKKNRADIDQETVGRTDFMGKMKSSTVNMLPLPRYGDVEQAVEYISLEFKREFWTIDWKSLYIHGI